MQKYGLINSRVSRVIICNSFKTVILELGNLNPYFAQLVYIWMVKIVIGPRNRKIGNCDITAIPIIAFTEISQKENVLRIAYFHPKIFKREIEKRGSVEAYLCLFIRRITGCSWKP